MLYFQEAKMKK